MAHPSASFSFTLRVRLENRPGTFANLARAIADAGGLLDAIDLVRCHSSLMLVSLIEPPPTTIGTVWVKAGSGSSASRRA